MSSLDHKVSLCESKIGYTFTERLRCATALNTASIHLIWESSFRLIPKNQELAVYGNVVMAAKLCRDWYSAGLSKGAWSSIVQGVASNANLDRVGRQFGLNACVNLNAGTVSVSAATMATTVEAILGAVHLDGGEEALAAVMERLGLTHELLVQAVGPSFATHPGIAAVPAP